MARPSDYTPELAERICAQLIEGRSLRAICREDTGMPNKSTVLRWLERDPDFAARYALARELQADTLAEEILEIADDGLNDTYRDADGNVRVDHDVVQRSKLRVDSRKWLAAKLAPKKYGDATKLQLEGGDRPIGFIDVPAKETREEWLARHAAALPGG